MYNNTHTKMDIEKVRRTELKSIRMQIRTKPSISRWMKKYNISPSKVFDEAIKELMKETNNKDNELIRTGKKFGMIEDAITDGLVGRRKK